MEEINEDNVEATLDNNSLADLYGSIIVDGVRVLSRIQSKYENVVQLLTIQEEKKKVVGSQTYMKKVVKVMFTTAQMSASKGIELFGERAVAEMVKELKQLSDGAIPGKKVVVPIDPENLTHDEKRQALEAVHCIKEKRNGITKDRTCANGSKQRMYLKEG